MPSYAGLLTLDGIGTQPAVSPANGMSRHRHSWRLAQSGATSRRT